MGSATTQALVATTAALGAAGSVDFETARELFAEAFNSSAEKHNQTLYGLLIIIGGLVGGALGIALGTPKTEEK